MSLDLDEIFSGDRRIHANEDLSQFSGAELVAGALRWALLDIQAEALRGSYTTQHNQSLIQAIESATAIVNCPALRDASDDDLAPWRTYVTSQRGSYALTLTGVPETPWRVGLVQMALVALAGLTWRAALEAVQAVQQGSPAAVMERISRQDAGRILEQLVVLGATSQVTRSEESGASTVDERYARGEITREEFLQLKQDLTEPEIAETRDAPGGGLWGV